MHFVPTKIFVLQKFHRSRYFQFVQPAVNVDVNYHFVIINIFVQRKFSNVHPAAIMDVDMQAVVMKIFVPKKLSNREDNEGNSGMFFS